MSSITVSMIVFTTVSGSALLGILLRSVLPPRHLSEDSKDIVKLGTGLVGTMAALVLGLFVASAKSSYDAQDNELTQLSAVLAHYGAEAHASRDLLRGMVARICERVWPKDGSTPSGLEPAAANESIYDRIQKLSPKDDTQRALQAQALSIASGLLQTHWLMYEQSASPVPVPVLVILLLWLTLIFISFGLFAPRNATVIASLLVSALSVSSAIFLILEMYTPFEGLIQISGAPLYAALAHLGR